MFKYFSLSVFFLLVAGSICAAGNKTTVTPGCKTKTERKTIKPAAASKDAFKAKYWILASIFRQ